jgi:hypothetical protein
MEQRPGQPEGIIITEASDENGGFLIRNRSLDLAEQILVTADRFL